MINKMTNQSRRNRSRKSQRGQVLIIVVFAVIGLVAFVGLVVDTGLVFIGNGKLRRATDAAALAAAAAYRKHPEWTDLQPVAMEYLTLNQISQAGATVHLICDPTDTEYDSTQCLPAKRRLVKVDATSTVNLAFLPVIGIRSVTLNATATSEAASLDIVLAIDVSESMTHNASFGALMRDPAECNDVPNLTDLSNCQPFRDIQQAAISFVSDPTYGLFPADGSNQYDRVAVIPFDRLAHYSGSHTPTGYYNDPLYLSQQASFTPINYRQKIINEISELRVFNASGVSPSAATHTPPSGPLSDGTCLDATGALTFPQNPSDPKAPCRNYVNNDGTSTLAPNYPKCFEQPITTNPPHWQGYSLPVGTPGREDIFSPGAGCFTQTDATAPYQGPFVRPSDGMHFERTFLDFACPLNTDPKYCPGTTNTGGAFLSSGEEFVNPAGFRQQSLWVVILLTDGSADHTNSPYYCPNGDGAACQDPSVKTFNSGTRHCLPFDDALYANNGFLFPTCMDAPAGGTGGIQSGGVLDPGYTYDADDYARDMADFVALGQQALIYTIGFGTDMQHINPINPASAGEQLLNYAADIGDDGKIDTGAGQANTDYFYAPNGAALQQVFKTISDRISTRLTH